MRSFKFKCIRLNCGGNPNNRIQVKKGQNDYNDKDMLMNRHD